MAIDILEKDVGNVLPEPILSDLVIRIQLVGNILVQSENKIWLRTKKGREMLSEFEEASKTLHDKLKTNFDVEEVKKSVVVIETYGKKLEGEIRRRSMVVT